MSDVEVNFILIPRDSATKDGINARQKMELALQPLPVHILMLRVSRSALLWHLILPQFKVFFFIYFFLIFFLPSVLKQKYSIENNSVASY